MRTMFTDAMKDAMRAGDKPRLGAVRLIIAAMKEKDIEARGAGRGEATKDEILGVLQKMIKQRQESADIYQKAGRTDLEEIERAEIATISSFLPQQMADSEVHAAIQAAIAETGAAGMKDMGKVIAVLRAKYAGQMDFGKASGMVKTMLG